MKKGKKLLQIFLTMGLIQFAQSGLDAQIIPDKTLGSESSSVNRIDERNIRVEDGAIRAQNLFHSFKEFNIEENVGVYFANPTGVERIFFRVTGANPSEILGRLGVLGDADLFFLNPNGIRFGSRATLELNGSFLATTASSIIFQDGEQFSASNPSSEPLLTVSIPIGLSFFYPSGSIQISGDGHNLITNNFLPTYRFPASSTMRVKPSEQLAIIGGDVTVSGGVLEGTNVIVGAIKSGEIFWHTDSGNWSLDMASVEKYGDVILENLAAVDASGVESGIVELFGRDLVLDGGSLVLVQSQTGGGQISVTGESLVLRNWYPSGVIIPVAQAENAGTAQVFDFIQFDLESELVRGGLINGNPIPPGSELSLVLSSLGLDESSFMFLPSVTPSFLLLEAFSGQGGSIQLEVGEIKVLDGAGIIMRNYGDARAGIISIVSKNLEISGFSDIPEFTERGSAIFSSISSFAFGSELGASIFINAETISAFRGGTIVTSSFNTGDGGFIDIKAAEVNLFEIIPNVFVPSAISTVTGNLGDAGSINMEIGRLFISDGAGVNSITLASGQSGSVNIQASELIEISGISESANFSVSAINSSALILPANLIDFFDVPSSPTGNSGEVRLDTPRLVILDGKEEFFSGSEELSGQISVRNEGTGNAGNLIINTDELIMDAGVISATTASGNGGNILINSDTVLLKNGSFIEATAAQFGNGGNIQIDSDLVFFLDSSEVSANAIFGDGGNIEISSDGFFASQESVVSASSEFGIDGNVEIKNDANNLRRILVTPRLVLVPEENILEKGCEIRFFGDSITGSLREFPKNETSLDYDEFITLTVIETPLEIIYFPEDTVLNFQKTGDLSVPATTVARSSNGRIVLINEARLAGRNLPQFPKRPDFCKIRS